MNDKIQKIEIDQIEVKDQLHRTGLEIESLAGSIQEIGQINPIVVKRAGQKYRVIAGRRRFAALKAIQKETGEKQTALVVVKDLDQLQEDLIVIDENLMRQDLSGVEYDEALFRRKQIYEQLHPETKDKVAGAVATNAKAGKSAKGAIAFTKDVARKLNISKRTVEKAIARAAKATDAVKKARTEGKITPSQVNLLVGLPAKDQNELLAVVKGRDLADTKYLVQMAHKRGARATVLVLQETKEDPAKLKNLVRDSERLTEIIKEFILEEIVFQSESRWENVKKLEEMSKQLSRFINFQRSEIGAVKAIARRGGERIRIKEAFQG